MSADLYWRSLTPSNSSRFNVSGTELSVATFGEHGRYAAYEIRCQGADGYPDRYYVVRDANLVSDAEIAAGKRPPIVGRTDDYNKLLSVVRRISQSAIDSDPESA